MLNGPVRSVQQRLGRDTLEIGLWLNEAVVVDPAVESLREDLDRLGVVVRGCNGFPQTSFHAPVVKRSVYRPHWGQLERLQYTKRLAEVLVKIGHGPVREISTVPIGHRELGAEMLPTAVRSFVLWWIFSRRLKTKVGSGWWWIWNPSPIAFWSVPRM